LPVATNPAEHVADTSFSDSTTVDDDTTVENEIENDAEMPSLISDQDLMEQDKTALGSDAVSDHARADPHADPLVPSVRGRTSSQVQTYVHRCARSLSTARPRSASPSMLVLLAPRPRHLTLPAPATRPGLIHPSPGRCPLLPTGRPRRVQL
jgi:hypothetical protein